MFSEAFMNMCKFEQLDFEPRQLLGEVFPIWLPMVVSNVMMFVNEPLGRMFPSIQRMA